MTSFIGRKRELDLLLRAYSGSEAAFIPIYGRRRVGKSELILQLLRQHPGLYFVGKRASADLQRREFLQEAAVALREPLLANFDARDWRTALQAVYDRSDKSSKLLLAFDEFQWTVETSPELPSLLQELWDRRWRRERRVLLLLCGSFIGFMEREVLGSKSPLFGRRTAQILLQPFSYAEAALFHPRWSIVDNAKAYFLCGGIPLYLKCFEDSLSIDLNLQHHLLDEFSVLHREPDFLLREELREVEKYYAVLLSIASGTLNSSEIAKEAGVDRSISYYLSQLAQLGYVERSFPLTATRPAARHVRFALADPLLRFWFRFVFPNLSFLRHAGPARTLRERVRPHLDSWFGSAFERLCREALPQLYRKEGVEASFQVGEYWSRKAQVDVVGVRDDNWTDLGECKWGTVRSLASLCSELEERVKLYPNERNATLGRRLFLRAFSGSVPPGYRVHTLQDLYAAADR